MCKQACHKRIINALPIVCAAILGFCAFCVIYGLQPLNPTNDKWIMSGYDEEDVVIHYAGWLAFRNSEWLFPLGLANKMAIGEGVLISYTDSIPWVAILFKIFRGLLPETFQFFGLYIFVCFGLQAVGAYKILMFKTKNMLYSYLGIIVFCFAPIFLERSFRHTALGSHWLILFAILFYFQYKDSFSKKYYIYLGILEALAIGIHPYFLPMVAIFSFLCMVEGIFINHDYKLILYFFMQQFATYIIGCLLGVLGNKIPKSRGGFGVFCMNLNALSNPVSLGGYTWSNILKVHPQTLGNYDGFNYLGTGILITIFIFVIILLLTRPWNKILDKLKKYGFLITACIFLTMFAISNVVTFNESILFTVPLPAFIKDLCGIFRASSRMFYPVYYLIFIFLLIIIWDVKSIIGIKSVYILIGILTIVQIADMTSVIIEKHIGMSEKCEYISILDDDQMRYIASNSNALLLGDSDIGNSTKNSLAVWALKNGLGIYYPVAAESGAYEVSTALKEEVLERIRNTHEIGENVMVTSDSNILNELSTLENVSLYRYQDVWLIFKKSEFMTDSNYVDGREEFTVADLTDSNWNRGVSIDNRTLLFNYSDAIRMRVWNSNYILVQDELYKILDKNFDNTWIRVTLDRDAISCAYPAVLKCY